MLNRYDVERKQLYEFQAKIKSKADALNLILKQHSAVMLEFFEKNLHDLAYPMIQIVVQNMENVQMKH